MSKVIFKSVAAPVGFPVEDLDVGEFAVITKSGDDLTGPKSSVGQVVVRGQNEIVFISQAMFASPIDGYLVRRLLPGERVVVTDGENEGPEMEDDQ